MNEKYGFDTLSVHAGYTPDSETKSQGVPIYPSTAYVFKDTEYAKNLFELKEEGYIYSRLGNPTNAILENRIAALEGGIGAVVFSSGHAAITFALLNIASSGDEIISSSAIYGGAINLLGVSFKKIGIKVRFVNPDDFEAIEKAVNEKTKAIFTETVGNPNANVADIEALAAIAHKHNLPLIVDSTFTTPYLLKPFDWGADIVIHSATKFLSGHGNSMSGVVVDSGKFNFKDNPRFPELNTPDEGYHGIVYTKDFGSAAYIVKLRVQMLRDFGACASPFNSYLAVLGIETLSLRMRKHCDNALKTAEFLKNNPNVEFVNYPALKGNKYYALSQKYMPKGCGSIFTFGLKGGKEAGIKFIESVKLFSHLANVGDVRSLVIHPASTTHSQLNSEQLKAAGITEGTIRLSIGIEDIEDIIKDLDNAINEAVK